MTKFLGYCFLFMIVVGGCVGAFDDTDYTTDTTVPAVVSVVETTIAIAVADTVPATVAPRVTTAPRKKSTISSGDDIDCDEAEELYDSGELSDDIADYCDYGPDGEWDTQDDYDSWEE
jgi:hypothetical protein